MGARPIALKCPSCHRGEYGYDRPERGIVQSGRTEKRRRAKRLSTMHESRCLDCGHIWWSTLLWVIDLVRFANRGLLTEESA
jgi:hypothetical protein